MASDLTRVRVAWGPVPGASGYRISWRTDSGPWRVWGAAEGNAQGVGPKGQAGAMPTLPSDPRPRGQPVTVPGLHEHGHHGAAARHLLPGVCVGPARERGGPCFGHRRTHWSDPGLPSRAPASPRLSSLRLLTPTASSLGASSSPSSLPGLLPSPSPFRSSASDHPPPPHYLPSELHPFFSQGHCLSCCTRRSPQTYAFSSARPLLPSLVSVARPQLPLFLSEAPLLPSSDPFPGPPIRYLPSVRPPYLPRQTFHCLSPQTHWAQ